ncbi:DEAD/DEAH box helicase family protein [uncultured Clostridium sp.]|uniref:DEAD/DEAH box helicase family protein n=1 Tax=uncultured Clostridium sp. TaxID=59620 RepID=UPI00344F2603
MNEIKSLENIEIEINEELNYKEIEEKYLVNNKLITNSESGNLLNELKIALEECEKFYFSVAFINFSGIQLLLDSFKEAEERGVKGKIITSTYLNFTEPKALKRLDEFKNIDLKVFVANEIGFHTKAYIFENKEEYKIIIGSSNITQSALKSNIEWNVLVISKREDSFINEVILEYKKLWESTEVVNEEFLSKYEKFLSEIKKVYEKEALIFEDYNVIKPNSMQSKATLNLQRLRAGEEDKALVIAATGTGKTYMSAFDVLNYKPKKMLFLVHREDILRKAKETFTKLVKNKNLNMGLLTGTSKEIDGDYLFSTIQSMNNSLDEFKRDEFEYIIIDEAHHASSPSYTKVLEYFNPKFLLGMTATPERSDNGNIFEIFDNNIALEVRLHEALEEDLVIPFHYFGITDIEGIDLSNIKLDNIAEVSKRLQINRRVEFIVEKMNFYGYDGQVQKCIGFCIDINHAKYMTSEFNKRGIESICLTGEDSGDKREETIKRLESDEDSLKVIFTVDIFNEGVDIPSVNQVLMLRPTSSPIVFIQQLGRGLRKHKSKEFLTVLDFIGNHNKAFLIAIALNGRRYYDKDSLKVAVATDFAKIKGCTNIQMDRISQERILEQLNNENFNSLKYLKEEYMEFKKERGEKIPYYLMDYIEYEGAPDPLKFSNYPESKTYLGFIAKVEKDVTLEKYIKDDKFIKF